MRIAKGTTPYKSKEIPWTNARDFATFDASFIPKRGPNGGIMVVTGFAIHAILNMTIATAVGEGEDNARFVRSLSVKLVDGHKPYDDVTGDSLRLIGWAHNGAPRQHEHQDLAIAATTDRKFSIYVPLSKPYAYEPDDTAVPADFLQEIRVGMADDTQFDLGTTAATIISGTYWIVADCYEQMSIVLPSLDCWRQVDGASTSAEQIDVFTGGRLQDVLLYCPGQNGGGSLANLSEAGILNLMDNRQLKDPDLKLGYARKRGAANNAFSTIGDPRHSDPFTSADSGTLRALAVWLTDGNKVFQNPERDREQIRLKLTSALPAAPRVVARYTVPVSEALDALIRRNHGVNAYYYKTRDKTRRDPKDWARTPGLARYLPRKYFRVDGQGRRIG